MVLVYAYGMAGNGGIINFTLWSEVMLCPQRGHEIVFFDHAVDTKSDPRAVRSEFPCPGRGVLFTKWAMEPYRQTVFDPLLEESTQRAA